MTSLLLALLAAVGLAGGSAFAAPPPETAPTARVAKAPVPAGAMDAVAAMQPSWNLGNALDAIPDETSWDNPATTKAMFDTVKAQGYRSVRIPVTWGNRQSATAPYTIDPAFMSRVRQVVDWALADDLYVVLNVHHDSWQWINKMATDHDQVLARYNATWDQIATVFKDESRKLLFESVNEPVFDNATDAQKAELLNELNTSFHSIVRQKGGRNATRLLVLPTHWCTPDQKLMDELATTMASLHDPHLVATVHYYSFWPFSVNIAGYTRFNAEVQKDLTDTFARMHDTFTAKGIPVYVGEYGLFSYPDYTKPTDIVERGEALKYYEATGSFAVPTEFRGDVLATMEAKYADGGNAGIVDWTSYQQFDIAFLPDYGGNSIKLTPAFLNALREGAPVTLTFHFWSGATVTYQVTKSGSSVTGTTS